MVRRRSIISRRHKPRRRVQRRIARRGTKVFHPRRGRPGRPNDAMIYKGLGIPDQYFTRVQYNESFTMQASVGNTYQVYQFRGNGCYDPNYTGTGAQPQWFDQLCGASALYKNYLVYGSKVVVWCNSASDSFAAGNMDFAVTPCENQYSLTSWTNIDDQLSYKGTKRCRLVRYDNNGGRVIKYFCKTKNLAQVKDVNDNLSSLGAAYNANPTTQWFWIMGMQGMDRTSTSAVCNVRVQITYYVRFYNSLEPAQS